MSIRDIQVLIRVIFVDSGCDTSKLITITSFQSNWVCFNNDFLSFCFINGNGL